MLINSYQHIPEKINPVAFHLDPIEVSWYGLMYLAAFATVYFLVRYRIRKKETGISLETVQDFFPWAILGTLLGARLGDVLIYDWAYFQNHLLQIFLPFDVYNGWQYIGIYGMSFFGGLVGLALAFTIFSFLRSDLKNPLPLPNFKSSPPAKGETERGFRKKTLHSVLNFSDLFAPAVPLALAFGRLGNFLNGELYGRVTTAPWGMYFPADITGQLRHPSQLYELFLEGILLFAILWILRSSPFIKGGLRGILTAFFLIGYGLARFAAEFFRQPDNNWFFLSFTIGQWFSLAIILVGLIIVQNKKAAE